MSDQNEKLSREELDFKLLTAYKEFQKKQQSLLKDADKLAKRRHLGMWRPFFLTANQKREQEIASRGINDYLSSQKIPAHIALMPELGLRKFYQTASEIKNSPKPKK